MTWTQGIGLRDVLTLLEFAIHSNSELRIFQNSQNYFTCAFRRDKLDKFLIPDNQDDFFTGIGRLINNGAYSAAYPLHEAFRPVKAKQNYVGRNSHSGNYELDQSNEPPRPENARQLLFHTWVKANRWYKMQPLDHIRDYFGEKIGIYFAWLASIMGLICVIYGLAKLGFIHPCVAFMSLTNEFTDGFLLFSMSMWADVATMCSWNFWKRRQAEIDLMNGTCLGIMRMRTEDISGHPPPTDKLSLVAYRSVCCGSVPCCSCTHVLAARHDYNMGAFYEKLAEILTRWGTYMFANINTNFKVID
ncbi:Anoctamin-7 [Desmophyllum pertusum]|uniref:Anoctamin n=1 Tax=Desmophyllum pertusum TaxID=174260 RepID=A0A9X0CVP7_9CNID|nr:Anoctamin-7 [Desmophyllum pertusum]